jgi:DNA-binding response OmpR family regulator
VAFGHSVLEAASIMELEALCAGAPLIVVAPGRARDEPAALAPMPKRLGTGARAALMARIRSELRRSERSAGEEGGAVEVGRLRIDPIAHEVRLSGRVLAVPRYELRLLAALARNAGRVLSLDELARATWGEVSVDKGANVRGLVLQLRRKLEPDPVRPRWLITKRGVGYCLRDDPDAI